MPNPETIPNPWRETVEAIYDKLHFEEPGFFSGDPLAKSLIFFIETRHPGYFVDATKRKGRFPPP